MLTPLCRRNQVYNLAFFLQIRNSIALKTRIRKLLFITKTIDNRDETTEIRLIKTQQFSIEEIMNMNNEQLPR